MSMKKSLVIFLVCFSEYTYGQNSQLSLMQGNWQGSNMEGETIFKLVKGNKCLEFTFAPKADEVDFTLFELIIGFQNHITSSSYDSLYLKFNSLGENGLYYTEILSKIYIGEDGVVVKPNFLIPSYYECDGNILSINGGKLFEFEKIEKVPFEELKKLYLKGKLNKRDYLKDYLNLKALSINSRKCLVHSDPGKPLKIRLDRGDIVVILEENGKWLKVKYKESSIGWIKEEDVK
jgi:hypothetical protein